jgi:CBS domain-containing protein
LFVFSAKFVADNSWQLNQKSFVQLLDPVGKWMASRRLLWVQRTTSLGAVARRMAEWRAHRVFVVESEETMQLAGVISLHDVLKHLAT